jgi:hypothetical protein
MRHTQTIQMVRHPFISRFLCDEARTLGFPPFRLDGGGGFKVLYDSQTFKNTMATRRTGTNRPIIMVASCNRRAQGGKETEDDAKRWAID